MPVRPLRAVDPRVVGPYRLTARLGSGGMGIVYLGEDAAGRRSAVKVLRDEHAGDQLFLRRFAREVRAAAAVDSPRVARLVDADPEAETPWLATEYIEGPTLTAEVGRNGPLSAAALQTLAVELAMALVAIHGAGVVHRDLKPGNVMLAEDGAKVIDFGIAAGVPGTVTVTGVVLGSVGYMAPELLTTTGTPGPAADVFSWALTLAFAASGRPPFGEGPLQAMLLRTLHDNVPVDGLPNRLGKVVSKALDKRPDRRPTARQLLDRLPAVPLPPAAALSPATTATAATTVTTATAAAAAAAAAAATKAVLLPLDATTGLDGTQAHPSPAGAGSPVDRGRRAALAAPVLALLPTLRPVHRRGIAATATVLAAAGAITAVLVAAPGETARSTASTPPSPTGAAARPAAVTPTPVPPAASSAAPSPASVLLVGATATRPLPLSTGPRPTAAGAAAAPAVEPAVARVVPAVRPRPAGTRPNTTPPRGPSGRVDSPSTCAEPDARRLLPWLGADGRCGPIIFGQPERAAREQAGDQHARTSRSQWPRTSGHGGDGHGGGGRG
ncbi:serine/threonine-protein kinase [Frankia sp. AvcI1]|uniref:serine/threonine-protein kinase n=2 Tax=Frankia sp. AvcI1 TaxID=573496 RepID=UPI0021183AB1|nr:serine/threonine-protein kinase [Frankia sp. AvcI1]